MEIEIATLYVLILVVIFVGKQGRRKHERLKAIAALFMSVLTASMGRAKSTIFICSRTLMVKRRGTQLGAMLC